MILGEYYKTAKFGDFIKRETKQEPGFLIFVLGTGADTKYDPTSGKKVIKRWLRYLWVTIDYGTDLRINNYLCGVMGEEEMKTEIEIVKIVKKYNYKKQTPFFQLV